MARKIPASLTAAYNRAIKRQGGMAERTVRAALAGFIRENPDADVAEVREFAIELLKSAGDLYGNACSQAAFDLQDEIAREFGTKPPDVHGWLYEPDEESISKTAHYHAGKLVDGNTDGFVREISEAARFYAERGANATMIQTAKRQDAESKRKRRKGAQTHGVRFARVPQGATTCGFCFMLASRGFVYLSEESAGEFDKFHRHCDCRIVPGYPGMELEGYDYDGMYRRWKQCEEAIGVEDGWSYLRREETIREAETRDSGWLLTGKVPKVTFENRDLEAEIRGKRPHELATGTRLANNGVPPAFQVDERHYFDEAKGLWQTVGLADLANGYELKTMQDAGWNSVDRYIRNTVRKKEGVKAIVVDNFDNVNALSDAELIESLRKQTRWNGPTYCITREGKYLRVK